MLYGRRVHTRLLSVVNSNTCKPHHNQHTNALQVNALAPKIAATTGSDVAAADAAALTPEERAGLLRLFSFLQDSAADTEAFAAQAREDAARHRVGDGAGDAVASDQNGAAQNGHLQNGVEHGLEEGEVAMAEDDLDGAVCSWGVLGWRCPLHNMSIRLLESARVAVLCTLLTQATQSHIRHECMYASCAHAVLEPADRLPACCQHALWSSLRFVRE